MERSFYARDPKEVARDLLGAEIVKGEMRARIVETEAYYGKNDPASHAFNGETERNRPMFGPPGRAYVYLIYGMYDMLNVTCKEEGEPGAVLIRAAEPVSGISEMRDRRGSDELELDGPGKLCDALGIDRGLTGETLTEGDPRIELKGRSPDYRTSGRVGVSEDLEEDLRFFVPR